MKKIFFKSSNKLMKFFKENSKIILIIIITTLIVGSVTTFASYNYFAKDIEYEKKDGTKISVENALNELYKNYKKPKDIKYYSAGDTNNFVSTYTATENCIVIAVSIAMHNMGASNGFHNCSINSDGILIDERTTDDTPAILLVKIYSLISGQKITCTSSAYNWGSMSHEFIVF